MTKWLISDLDGTLYPRKESSNPRQLEENLEAVRRWVKQGHHFVAATARGLHHYASLAEKLGFEFNYIGCNGAEVRLETGEMIVKQMPNRIFIDLCNLILKSDWDASVATGIDDQWVWSSLDRYPCNRETVKPFWSSAVVADLKKIDPQSKTERIQIFVPAGQREALKDLLLNRKIPAGITTSDVDMIDISPLNCSKGISIQEICQQFGVHRDQLIVVGDSQNDIPMFEMTEHSYCIDLADPQVLCQASQAVSSLAEVIRLEEMR